MNKNNKNSYDVVRVALYIRVSTEEQAMHGLSLDAQQAALEKYCHEHNYKIVGTYIDSGKTARKSIARRVELHRLLEDVQNGKIDLIVFTKLDRWFRNVKDYYKVQEVLEQNNVNWRTIFENYDTSTANGRLHINIMLSIAQDEADRTSERIKAVFASKIAKGEATNGMLPIGYKLVNSKIVIDCEKAYIAKELFSAYLLLQSQRAAATALIDKYGIYLHNYTVKRMLTNPIYMGTYRDIPNFCEPIISEEDFNKVQEIVKNKSIKNVPSKYDFIFTGLLQCAECGCRMASNAQLRTYSGGRKDYYVYYRCNRYHSSRRCNHSSSIGEKALEKYLFENIEDEINSFLLNYELEEKAASKKPRINKSEIRRKLERLKELYINDLIDIDTYKKDYSELTEKLNTVETKEEKADLTSLRDFLNSNFKETYDTLDNKSKRILWRGIIDRLEITADNKITIKFTN